MLPAEGEQRGKAAEASPIRALRSDVLLDYLSADSE